MTDQPNALSPEYLLIGQVQRPHGVRGELRVRMLTDYPERVNDLKQVYISKTEDGQAARTLTVIGMRMHQGHGLLRVEEVQSRGDADRLRRMYVLVPLEDAVPLEDDEFYLFQVIGMQVQTSTGDMLGTIKSVIETGANDVYVIDSPDYGEILFPITPETLIKHDMETRIVHVILLDGLLPKAPD